MTTQTKPTAGYRKRGRPKKSETQTELNAAATKSQLTKEIGGPSIGTIRSPFETSIAGTLTPEKLSSIIARADSGDIYDLMLLAQEIEEREPHFASVMQTRKYAIRSLTFQMKAMSENEKEKKIAAEIQTIVDSSIFRKCVNDLLDAISKGFSAVEIVWDTSKKPWTPKRFIYQPQHFFTVDQKTGTQIRLRSEKNTTDGIELPDGKFIIHRSTSRSGPLCRSGIARTVASLYLVKAYALKDWVNFCEVYGFPLRIGKHAPNASADERSNLLQCIASLGHNAAAVMPVNMTIETQPGVTGNHGSSVFGDLIDLINKEVSKVVLGQTMTTEGGSSRAQAMVHERVRSDILWADAQALSDTINEQFVRQYVEINYGPDAPVPLLHISEDNRDDLTALSAALVPFIDRGLVVSQAEIAAKFGLTPPNAVTDKIELPLVPGTGNGGAGSPAGGRSGTSRNKPPSKKNASVPSTTLT